MYALGRHPVSQGLFLLNYPVNPGATLSGFTYIPGVDVDHSVSYNEMEVNIVKLWNYLNDPKNSVFSKDFIEAKGIGDFFKQDKQDRKIKPTLYLFKACSNNIDNLWLICGGCNTEKSKKDPLAWFTGLEDFGKPFLDAIKKEGGLNRSVISSRVGGEHIGTLQFKVSNTEIEEQEIYAGGIGLGKFTRNWYVTTHGEKYKQHRDFYTKNYRLLKDQLLAIQKMEDPEDAEQERMKLSTAIRRAHVIQKESAAKRSTEGDEGDEGDFILSGESTDSLRTDEKEFIKNVCRIMNDTRQELSKMKKRLKELYPRKESEIKEFLSYVRGKVYEKNFQQEQISLLSRKTMELLRNSLSFDEFKEKTNENIKEVSIPREEFLSRIGEEKAGREQERVAKEQERAAKEQERAAKEQERAGREQERAAKEQERAAREKAESELQKARKLIAEFEAAKKRGKRSERSRSGFGLFDDSSKRQKDFSGKLPLAGSPSKETASSSPMIGSPSSQEDRNEQGSRSPEF